MMYIDIDVDKIATGRRQFDSGEWGEGVCTDPKKDNSFLFCFVA